ncbi:hypothetical protein RYZ26_01530 [Terasakiella sp. A23]|uniref:hypothetical protein n=1 Tax=Terasakiella sp. FCG-A23 TaxID=3080561 RepID=UPI002953E558|nr:hypothetical protein [Terasakiella sp. A23]MDV7338257.1 hypothetical protein [Terasakiella sp. A23]
MMKWKGRLSFVCLFVMFTGCKDLNFNLVYVPNFPVTIAGEISSAKGWRNVEIEGSSVSPIYISNKKICPNDILHFQYQLTKTYKDWLINLELKAVTYADGTRYTFKFPRGVSVGATQRAEVNGKQLSVTGGYTLMVRPSSATWPIKPWPIWGSSNLSICQL